MLEFFKMWNWLGRLGLIGGIIGLGVGLWTVINIIPEDGYFPLIIFVGVLLSTLFIFKSTFGPQVEAQIINRTGIAATAKILAVKETGVTVNNIYYLVKLTLEVQPKDQPAYQTTIKTLISRLTIAQFQPGAIVNVKYDPKKPQKVALAEALQPTPVQDSGTIVSEEQQKQLENMLKEIDQRNKEILANGEEATATIIKSWEMGINVNGDNPLMGFLLEVQPKDKPHYTAEAKAPIMATSIPKYQAGKTIFVKFDPSDRTKVTLFHS